jgi:hypothetical protein
MYSIVLFKNNSKKKIIKTFKTLKNAKNKYNDLINKSNNVIFDVKVENFKDCTYELALIGNANGFSKPNYLKDSIGRNIKIKLDAVNLEIIEISEYKKEEFLFDVQTNKKIKVNSFINEYLSSNNLKVISVLNNKIILQNDDTINIFSVKNPQETVRFIDSLSNYFFNQKRFDCIFVNDTSTPQKKYLINLLSEYGFDKKILYRQFTTTHKK